MAPASGTALAEWAPKAGPKRNDPKDPDGHFGGSHGWDRGSIGHVGVTIFWSQTLNEIVHFGEPGNTVLLLSA